MWKHLRDVICLALLLPLRAIGSPVPAQYWPSTPDFEVIVIGGGPAGLSALSGLARVRRTALLIDSGEYRNGLTRHAHDIIAMDGLFNSYSVAREDLTNSVAIVPSLRCNSGVSTSEGAGTDLAISDCINAEWDCRLNQRNERHNLYGH